MDSIHSLWFGYTASWLWPILYTDNYSGAAAESNLLFRDLILRAAGDVGSKLDARPRQITLWF
jgi:hypothetical protein